MQPDKIALNFLPLLQQDFTFDVYRRPWNGERKEDFAPCSKRKLPSEEIDPNQGPIFREYLVSLTTRDGFQKFTCHSETNLYLTLEVMYASLLSNCRNNLEDFQYEVDEGLRDRVIFKIEEFPGVGYQTVWLEPYLLKSAGIFGFLADFKFYMSPKLKFSRRVQQFSLSLDKDGKSNINFYADRFEMLQRFIAKYFEKISGLRIGGNIIYLEKKLVDLESDLLKSKKYIFTNNKPDSSQFMGVKNHGPYQPAPNEVKLYFVYREQDKPYSQDLFRALRGDIFSTTFPGMEKMFHYSLGSQNVGGKAVKDFDYESLTAAIESISRDAGGRPLVPIVLTPFSKDDENEESSTKYFTAKHVFLRHHIPSQFVSLKKLTLKEQLKWAISNIGLQLFAKMGGIPWIVSPQTNRCLIIGLGQAHKKIENSIQKYFAYSVLTESTGLYKDLRVLGLSANPDNYLTEFRENLEAIFRQYIDQYENFVVHVTFSMRKNELQTIQGILDKLSGEQGYSKKKFVVMRFNDDNKFFGYSRETNSKVPFESSFIQLSHDEFLVWFEGLQYHNPTIRKRFERPLYVKFLYPKSLSIFEMKDYLQDAVNISGANWRGFNAKSLPVSIYYAKLVANYYKEFQTLDLEEIDIEKITPWFL